MKAAKSIQKHIINSETVFKYVLNVVNSFNPVTTRILMKLSLFREVFLQLNFQLSSFCCLADKVWGIIISLFVWLIKLFVFSFEEWVRIYLLLVDKQNFPNAVLHTN